MPKLNDQSSAAIGGAGSVDELLQFRPVDSLSPEEFAALEELAFTHGQTPDSYLIVERQRLCYLAPDHSAAMSVSEFGPFIHIFGGILAPVERRKQIIIQLGELARKTGRFVNFYSIVESDRPLFEEAGWQVTKMGEDTSLKLESLSWSGKPYEWVRRQFNFCQRMGLSCREVSRETMDEESWKSLSEVLVEIQREDLRDRIYSKEMRFLVGKLQPECLGRRRLFIAEDKGQKRVEAFVIANPMRGGTCWAFEMYRKRKDGPRGAIPFLIKWIIDMLKAEGVEEVSLCILLWKDTHAFKGKRTSLLLGWGLLATYHLFGSLYSIKGIIHFKTRFRPELSNCYVCATPKVTLQSFRSFFRTIGAFTLNSRNLVRTLGNCLISRKREGV